VKFMFPNQFNVYLHDTPSRDLFAKSERSLSSGCIRLERPIDLALELLRSDSTWTAERLNRELATAIDKTVMLPRRVPVHLLYWTAWVDEDGVVQFRQDIYGRDSLLSKAVFEAPPEKSSPSGSPHSNSTEVELEQR